MTNKETNLKKDPEWIKMWTIASHTTGFWNFIVKHDTNFKRLAFRTN